MVDFDTLNTIKHVMYLMIKNTLLLFFLVTVAYSIILEWDPREVNVIVVCNV